MRYEFPRITHLEQVRPAIEGRDEFAINDRGEYMVVNYHVNLADTFPPVETVNDAIRRECRGMIFCSTTGKILRRPFHKFFNIQEKDETQLHKLDFTLPHTVYTKLDGSMVSPFEVGYGSGNIRFGTKAGITEVSMQAEEFVARNPKYMEFSRWCIANGITPMFEWTSRQQRIIIDYPTDNLTLLAARYMETGEFIDIVDV
jgi:RNA ligase